MALTIKADNETLPEIARFFGLGQPSPSDNSVMAPDASGNPMPLAGNSEVPQDPQPTKLDALAQLLNTSPAAASAAPAAASPAGPSNFEGIDTPPDFQQQGAQGAQGPLADGGMPIGAEQAGAVPRSPQDLAEMFQDPNAMPPADLAQSMVPGTPPRKARFDERHPTAAKNLLELFNFVQDASAGVGARTFGEGAQAAAASAERRSAGAMKDRKDLAGIADTNSQTNLRNAQAARAGKYSSVTINGATYEVPNDKISSLLGQQVAAGSREKVAHINADNKSAIADMNAQVNAGKIAFVKPIVNDQGQAVLGAYDRQGNLVKTLDKSIGPAWMLPTTRSSFEIKEDGNGGFVYIPKTSTTRRILPGNPQGGAIQQGTAPTQGAGTPSAGGGVARPVSSGAVRPITGPGGTQQGGKISKDAGYAYDPQTDTTVLTTRMEAGQKGLQDFRKVPQPEIEKDRKTVVRLQDVNLKTDRYANDFAQDISARDRMNMSAIISDDRLHIGISETKIPTGWMGKLTDSELFQNMSPTAKMRTIDYFQAREALSGYATILSGSSRSSDKNLQLQLEALPNPLWTPDDAQKGFQRWRENLVTVARGLPVLPGVNDHRASQPSGSPQTHVFSVSAWQKANPQGDANAAKQAAQAQGFQVTQ